LDDGNWQTLIFNWRRMSVLAGPFKSSTMIAAAFPELETAVSNLAASEKLAGVSACTTEADEIVWQGLVGWGIRCWSMRVGHEKPVY